MSTTVSASGRVECQPFFLVAPATIKQQKSFAAVYHGREEAQGDTTKLLLGKCGTDKEAFHDIIRLLDSTQT